MTMKERIPLVAIVVSIIAMLISSLAIYQSMVFLPASTDVQTKIDNMETRLETLEEMETRLETLENIIGPVDMELVAGAVQEGAVSWYTSMPDWQAQHIIDEWAKIYPEIQVSYYRSGSEAVIAKFLTELEAGAVQCDVIASSSPSGFAKLVNISALEAYKPPEYDYYPPKFKDPNGYWVTPRLITDLFWYNVELVQDPPKSWWDLADPKWKGKIVMGSPLTSGSALATLASTVNDTRFGWDLWKALVANDVLIVEQHVEAARMVSAGERLIGVCSWGYTEQYPEYPKGTIGLVVPEEGLICFDHSIGVVANSPHPNAGKLFYRFVLSAHIAAYIAQSDFCPRLDVPAPPNRPALSSIPTLAYPGQWVLENKDSLIEEFQKLFP